MLAFQNQQRSVFGRMPSPSEVVPSLTEYDSYSRYDNFPPSFDGPPTSEQMRAYEEQLRLQAMKDSYARPYPSTGPITFGWGEGWGEVPRLARKPSEKSTFSKKMGIDRPESVQMLAKSLFSRSSKKKTGRSLSNSRSSSSLSLALQTSEESTAARDNFFGHVSRKNSKSGLLVDPAVSVDEQNKPQISEPYNFQHVTHTRHDHLPNLERTSRLDLLSEFSAIRAAQAPTRGTIKGIKTTDLHSENSSADDLVNASRPKTSPHPPPISATTETRSHAPRLLSHARSCDELRQAPPPRPLPSPSSIVTKTIVPPPRTSSRRASTLYEQFNPLAVNKSINLDGRTSFRKPKAFHLPATPLRITRPDKDEEQIDSVTNTRVPAAVAWPLPTPPLESSGRFTGFLEESEAPARESQKPQPQHAIDTGLQTPRTSIVVLEGDSLDVSSIGIAISPTKHISLVHETWEDDIDYCYEHEAEADCEYNWSRASYENTTREVQTSYPAMHSAVQPDPIALRQPRSRPAYLMPSPLDIPALSPVSNTSAPSPELPTPCGLQIQPSHPASLSPSEPFQESHGFTLSPSLLVPKDYASQMTLYQHDMISPLISSREISKNNSHSVTDLILESYPLSLGDDTRSSTASFNTYRSSAASNSVCSPATTISKSGSMESMTLLSRGPSFVLGHRSANSKDSLPELTHSRSCNMLRTDREDGLSMKLPMLSITSAPSTALVDEVMKRFERYSIVEDASPCVLSPVAESFMEMPPAKEQLGHDVALPLPLCINAVSRNLHGRKISAPLLSAVASKEERAEKSAKGRKRASSVVQVASNATSKAKAYSLFPQI